MIYLDNVRVAAAPQRLRRALLSRSLRYLLKELPNLEAFTQLYEDPLLHALDHLDWCLFEGIEPDLVHRKHVEDALDGLDKEVRRRESDHPQYRLQRGTFWIAAALYSALVAVDGPKGYGTALDMIASYTHPHDVARFHRLRDGLEAIHCDALPPPVAREPEDTQWDKDVEAHREEPEEAPTDDSTEPLDLWDVL